jgi:hypothetical protein
VRTGVETLKAEPNVGPQRKARRAVERNVTNMPVIPLLRSNTRKEEKGGGSSMFKK